MFPVNNIRKICKLRNTSLAEIERDTGIGNGTIARWETSPRSPQFDHLQKISERLDCTLEELYSGELKEDNKKTATKSDGNQNSSNDELSNYANSLFNQLTTEKKIRLINLMQSELQNQEVQDVQK